MLPEAILTVHRRRSAHPAACVSRCCGPIQSPVTLTISNVACAARCVVEQQIVRQPLMATAFATDPHPSAPSLAWKPNPKAVNLVPPASGTCPPTAHSPDPTRCGHSSSPPHHPLPLPHKPSGAGFLRDRVTPLPTSSTVVFKNLRLFRSSR